MKINLCISLVCSSFNYENARSKKQKQKQTQTQTQTKKKQKKNITSSVYDCTVEDVEHSNA